jgi:hypothetical protein
MSELKEIDEVKDFLYLDDLKFVLKAFDLLTSMPFRHIARSLFVMRREVLTRIQQPVS